MFDPQISQMDADLKNLQKQSAILSIKTLFFFYAKLFGLIRYQLYFQGFIFNYESHQPHYRRVLTSVALAAIILTALGISLGAKSPNNQAQSFEYKVVGQLGITQQAVAKMQQTRQGSRNPSQMTDMLNAQAQVVEDTLNDLGKDGWELLEVNEAFYILKRKL